MIRKIDFAIQLLIVLLFFTALVWFTIANRSFNVFAFMILPVLSIWQLVSALLITFLLHRPEVKKSMPLYWKFALAGAAMFVSSLLFGDRYINENNVFVLGLAGAGLLAGAIASVYYLYVYKKYFLA